MMQVRQPVCAERFHLGDVIVTRAEVAIDAFCDPSGEVHRVVDLAATTVIVEAAGGVVWDLYGRPLTLEPDLSKRWSGIAAASPRLAEELIDVIDA